MTKPKPVARYSAQKQGTPTCRDADPKDVLLRIPPDDLAEAREILARPDKGVADLVDWFGWPEASAVRIAAALRDEALLKGEDPSAELREKQERWRERWRRNRTARAAAQKEAAE
jgi:hypothetical protein